MRVDVVRDQRYILFARKASQNNNIRSNKQKQEQRVLPLVFCWRARPRAALTCSFFADRGAAKRHTTKTKQEHNVLVIW